MLRFIASKKVVVPLLIKCGKTLMQIIFGLKSKFITQNMMNNDIFAIVDISCEIQSYLSVVDLISFSKSCQQNREITLHQRAIYRIIHFTRRWKDRHNHRLILYDSQRCQPSHNFRQGMWKQLQTDPTIKPLKFVEIDVNLRMFAANSRLCTNYTLYRISTKTTLYCSAVFRSKNIE